MTPHEFIAKWKPVALTERASAHEHVVDLCALFDHSTPAQADPQGATPHPSLVLRRREAPSRSTGARTASPFAAIPAALQGEGVRRAGA